MIGLKNERFHDDIIKVQAIRNIDLYTNIQGGYNKFPDFFRMGTFIDSTGMKL